MSKNAEEKTTVMRLLERDRAAYTAHCYAGTGAVSGPDVARVLGQDPDTVFKTLVTVGKSGGNYVFLLPVNRELDLKKAAACVGEKSVDMIPAKALLPLTGYVHGGCSPIGMKKRFPTVIDSSAEGRERILFSGGRIGYQVETTLKELRKALIFTLGDLCGPEAGDAPEEG